MGRNMVTIILALGLVATSLFNISLNKNNKDFAEDLMFEKQDSILAITHENGAGTVFVVETKKGKKVGITNNHVCADKSDFVLISRDGNRQYRSKLIANYKTHDLCMVTVPNDLPPLKLAEEIFIDDKIFSAGFAGMPAMSSTSGYFRTIRFYYSRPSVPFDKCYGTIQLVDDEDEEGRKIKVKACVLNAPAMFTTMPITLGASGSPIMNEEGDVVGVVMALGGTLSWCVGVPLKTLKDFLSKY